MRAFLIAAVLSLLLPPSSHAQAAPDAIVRLTPQQTSAFAPAFAALAQQAHRCLIAEDQPLHPALTPLAVAGLKLTKDGELLSTLLPKLAAAYDYDVQPSGSVFLLKKRYTDAADLPSVTVKECALGLEEAGRCAEGFNPHFPNNAIDDSPAMKDLVYSLTPEQLEAMADSKRGVPVASLAPPQQQDVWQFVLHLCVQRDLRGLPPALAALNQVAAGDARFGWRFFPQMNARLFGFDAPFERDGFQILSKSDQLTVHIGSYVEVHPVPVEGAPPASLTTMWLAPTPDPTDPAVMPAGAPRPAPPVSSSLGEILARLNARAADGLKVTVESYLASKQATAFGEEAVTPRQELTALADVYGLRVFTGDKEGGHDRLRLTRRTAQVPLTLLSLHDSVLQALPDPLVRACRMHESFMQSPLFVPAVRQLRAAAEPRLRASRDKDGRVALSALSEREGRALATLLMLDPMHSLGAWVEAAPPATVVRLDDVRLGGGLSEQDGKKQMDLILELPRLDDPTVLVPGPGVGRINYDPVKQTL